VAGFFIGFTGVIKEYAMHIFKGRCLCGMSQFSVSLTNFDVYACHCTLCQKWSGGIAMYLEAQGHPLVEDDSIAPSHFRPLRAANAGSARAAAAHCGLN
jgi:hypothetical protein